MANGKAWERTVVGSIVKSKDDTKANYVKVQVYRADGVSLKNGDFLQLQTNTFRCKSLDRDLAAGLS